MGSDLNCFDWTNQSSSFMDGSLAPTVHKTAEAHLDGCKECRERLQRYRLILESLHGLERYTAPAAIKYEREAQISTHPRKPATGWKRTDRFLRPLIKALKAQTPRTWGWISASVLGFTVLATLPKLQALYESRLQKRLDAVNFSELPVSQSPSQDLASDEDPSTYDDFSGDEGEEDLVAQDDSNADPSGLKQSTWEGEWDSSRIQPNTGNKSAVPGAQVWRFILRTDSPQDLRSRVHEVLISAGVSPQSRMIHGFVAPGGIQFDVLAPASSIPQLKEALQKLSEEHSPAANAAASDSPYPTEPFTWYRNRSKRPLPTGAARVVVWLSLT